MALAIGIVGGIFLGLFSPEQFKNPVSSVLFGILDMIGLMLIILAVQAVIVAVNPKLMEAAANRPETRTSALFIECVLAGPIEEGFFRGIMQQQLYLFLPTPLAILIPSVVFGVLHRHHWMTVVITGLIGSLLGFLYWYTGSLIQVAVAHAFLNAVGEISIRIPVPRFIAKKLGLVEDV